METAVSLSRLRESVEWDEVIQPYFKERHFEIASKVAYYAAKGDLSGIQLWCGRLLEVEGVLGLENLLMEQKEEEGVDNGRTGTDFVGYGRRFRRYFGLDRDRDRV